MKKISILRFLLVGLFANMCMAMGAEKIGDFETNLDNENKTAELQEYNGSATELVIPSSVTYEGVAYIVTSLGEKCFYGCETIKSISIPESVTSIGDGCFRSCSSLELVTLPTSSLTSIGASCFSFCSSLKSITIPESVTCLGEYCFANCSSLESIAIPESVTTLESSSFDGCSCT